MSSPGMFGRIGYEERLAATRHERQSEQLRLEQIKIRLGQKMEVAARENNRKPSASTASRNTA
jgi:hypothetical protein